MCNNTTIRLTPVPHSPGTIGSVARAGERARARESTQETKQIAGDRSHINHLSQFRGRKDRLRSKSFHWGSVPVAQRVNVEPRDSGTPWYRRGEEYTAAARITGLVDLTDQFDANHSFAIYTPPLARGYS